MNGVIYLYRVGHNHLAGSGKRNLFMFRKLYEKMRWKMLRSPTRRHMHWGCGAPTNSWPNHHTLTQWQEEKRGATWELTNLRSPVSPPSQTESSLPRPSTSGPSLTKQSHDMSKKVRRRDEKQLHRFYEPLVLLFTPGSTRGDPAPNSPVTKITSLSARDEPRKFLAALAYACDFESEFIGNDVATYAILSHTWGADSDEVSLQDVQAIRARQLDTARYSSALHGLVSEGCMVLCLPTRFLHYRPRRE
jgi:hypothetical protein